jgi:energy-coupling factor transporter ATP-binding protein EcfA2
LTGELTEFKEPTAPRTTHAGIWVEMKLPDRKTLLRFVAWGIGRVSFSVFLFSIKIFKLTFTGGVKICELIEQSTGKLLKIYDNLPYSGTPFTQVIETTATTVQTLPPIITDVVAAIEGKQVMVIGEMGSGKSTIAQFLAYSVGGTVKVYECEGTPDDWIGLEVIGKGEDWPAIEEGMQADLDDLSNQMKIRNEQGDAALNGTEKVIICEEYPELVNKVPSAGEWLERHARRGRKARRFTILLSQYDRVAAWGLEGKSDLADAFYRLRLGKKALAHAKSLNNKAIIQWLQEDKSHCLLDDQPCKLPAYREMKALPSSFGRTILQVYPNNSNNPEKASEKILKAAPEADSSVFFSESDRLLWRLIQQVGEGKSDSKLVTEILGYTGHRYKEGVALLNRLREQFAGKNHDDQNTNSIPTNQ